VRKEDEGGLGMSVG